MKRKKAEEPFQTLSIKAPVVKKFRAYCRSISKPQSVALLLMIDFFQSNGISPEESLGPHIQTLENLIKKRVEGLIAIIRNIEKTQTKPTYQMLQLLFQETPPKNRDLVLEKRPPVVNPDRQGEMEILNYRKQVMVIRDELQRKNRDLDMLLEKVVITRNSFGQVHLRLNMSKMEFEKFKQTKTFL